MRIFLHHQNVLQLTEADTLVLPVDGIGRGLEGNVARKFLKAIEYDSLDELYEKPIAYPFNGGCQWAQIEDIDETHFEYVCALGILSHQAGADHRGFIRSALYHMFEAAEGGSVGTKLACPVLSAGWRLPAIDALYLMVAEAERFVSDRVELHIAEIDPKRYAQFRTIVG